MKEKIEEAMQVFAKTNGHLPKKIYLGRREFTEVVIFKGYRGWVHLPIHREERIKALGLDVYLVDDDSHLNLAV